jgi:hypothetical protein
MTPGRSLTRSENTSDRTSSQGESSRRQRPRPRCGVRSAGGIEATVWSPEHEQASAESLPGYLYLDTRSCDDAARASTVSSTPSLRESPSERPPPMSATVPSLNPVVPADGSVENSTESASPLHPTAPVDRRWSGAIVIPAHNEAAVIARTLRSLAPLCDSPDVEVIVVCNGCSDDTAAIARGVNGVVVVDLPDASKTAALNVGDNRASLWPRLYLDADIEITPDAVRSVFEALERPGVVAARPVYVYDTTGAAASVQAYYRARSRIPAPPVRLWGAGGYALSEAGRRRFGSFPDVTADDSWIDVQFADHEKRVVPTIPMRVRTPRDVSGLLAVLTRQRRGQVELGIPSTATRRGRSLVASVRGPRSALDLCWYVLLTAVARRRSRAALRSRHRAWERDTSSRPDKGLHR